MLISRRVAGVVGIAAAAALAVSGCSSSGKSGGGNGGGSGSGSSSARATNSTGGDVNNPAAFDAAVTGFVNKTSTASSGTLALAASGDADSWDPGRSYYAWVWNMQRLYARTLMAYASIPGSNNTGTLAPDLATSKGQHNADFTQWTYTLKSGLKWQDGTPVTPADVKYGLERLYATDVINGGPTFYYLCLLDKCDAKGNPEYQGPYKDKTGGLSSITTTGNTITFKLTSGYSDFDYLMAVQASAPVPATREGGTGYVGATYTKHPLSNGPFEFQSYSPGKSVTWVRNPQWSQSTDTIRHPLVNKITLTIDENPDNNDKALQAGTVEAEADGGVQQTFQAQILSSASLKKNADNPVTGFTRYLVLIPSVKPLDNIHCRRAVFYAVSKALLQRARGGSTGGDIANTMAPPTLAGFDPNANPYPNGSGNNGDTAKAKAELKQCGQPNGFNLNMAYVNQGRGRTVFEATQQALKAVGINLQSKPGSQDNYYSTYIGSPGNLKKNQLGIAQAGWGADFPTGYGFWNSIVNGKAILPQGNTNYASLNDPVINNILTNVTKSAGTHDAEFKQLDAQVMKDAVMLPYVYDKTLFYRDPRLTNVRCNFALGGYYDFVNTGIKG